MSTNQQLIPSVYSLLEKFRTTAWLMKLKVLLLLRLNSLSRIVLALQFLLGNVLKPVLYKIDNAPKKLML